MTTIDTNVIVALWRLSDPFNQAVSATLYSARKRGRLALSAPVYAELMGDPARSESQLNQFLSETGIDVDWNLEEQIWRESGIAYKGYIERRRSSTGTYPRRILTDFLVGAHAMVRGYTLRTLDQRLYSAAFPNLNIISA